MDNMLLGQAIGVLGIALCVLLCGCGSAIALYYTGQAGSGVLAEDNKKFSKVLVMVVLPATQGIYGFVLAIVASSNIATITCVQEGLHLLFALLPLAVVGFASAVFQKK